MALRLRKSIPATRGLAEMMANLNFEIVAEQQFFTRPSHYVGCDLREKAENLICERSAMNYRNRSLRNVECGLTAIWLSNIGYITSEIADLDVETVRFHW